MSTSYQAQRPRRSPRLSGSRWGLQQILLQGEQLQETGQKSRSKEEGNRGTGATQAEGRQSKNTTFKDGQLGQKAQVRPADDSSTELQRTSTRCQTLGYVTEGPTVKDSDLMTGKKLTEEHGQSPDRHVRLGNQV